MNYREGNGPTRAGPDPPDHDTESPDSAIESKGPESGRASKDDFEDLRLVLAGLTSHWRQLGEPDHQVTARNRALDGEGVGAGDVARCGHWGHGFAVGLPPDVGVTHLELVDRTARSAERDRDRTDPGWRGQGQDEASA